MTVTDSTISGNSAERGGGIGIFSGTADGHEQHDQRQLSRWQQVAASSVSGDLTMTDSTISGNHRRQLVRRRRHFSQEGQRDGHEQHDQRQLGRLRGGGIYSWSADQL